MAITFVGYSSSSSGLSDPTGAADGDLLIAVIYNTSGYPNGTTIDATNHYGWSRIFYNSSLGAGFNLCDVEFVYKSGTVNYATFSSGGSSLYYVYAFRGTVQANFWDHTYSSFSKTYSSTPYANELLFAVVADNTSNTITPPGGMTAVGPTSQVGAAYSVITNAGTSNTITFGGGGTPLGICYIEARSAAVTGSVQTNLATAYTNVFASSTAAINGTVTATSSVTAFVVHPNVNTTASPTTTITATNTNATPALTTPSTSALVTVTARGDISPVLVRVELLINGQWVNISPSVLYRTGISISRGRRDESAVSDVAHCTFDVKNPLGNFTPLNPNSIYSGYITLNTYGRVWVLANTSVLSIPADGIGVYGPYNITLNNTVSIGGVSCPTTTALQITGNLEIQFDANIFDWGASLDLTGKLYYGLSLVNGYLSLFWTPNGVTFPSALSSIPLPKPWHGRKAIKATMQTNVAGNWNVNYYYANSFADAAINGWTQLGTTIVGSGTTSIITSGDVVLIGDTFIGKVYGVNIYSGLSASGGTLVASPDFTAQQNGATSFTDSVGNTWTTYGSAEIHKRSDRMHGFIPSWPMQWDKTGRDVYATLELAGAIRKPNQGVINNSAYYRTMTKSPQAGLLGYWPCEDQKGSTIISAAIGTSNGTFTGPVSFANDSSYPGSAAVLTSVTGSSVTFAAPSGTVTNQYTVRWIGQLSNNAGSTLHAVSIFMTGTAHIYSIYQGASNTLLLYVTASDGTLIVNGATITTANTTAFTPSQYQVDLSISGSVITITITIINVNTSVTTTYTTTISGYTLGTPSSVVYNLNATNTGISVGHLSIFNRNVATTSQVTLMNGWAGESAATRFVRLCYEENMPCVVYGSGPTSPMGAQSIANILQLLRECETVDGGIIFDSREQVGLCFRTRDSMATYAGPVVTLNYANADLSEIKPTYDDLLVKNVVQYTRTNGSSITIQDTTSSRRVSLIGQYGDSVSGNLQSDTAIADHAYWRLHIGTVDEYRYPNITFKLTRSNYAGTALGTSARALEIGDMLVINNQPSWLPPYSIRQITQGFTEKLNSTDWDISPNLSPASPFDIGQYNDAGTSRYDAVNSKLTSGITSVATTFQVTTTAPGQPWTTTFSMFPFDIVIDGEQITVTSIDTLAMPQTFTVIRSVNGVVLSHNANATVKLFHPVYYTIGSD